MDINLGTTLIFVGIILIAGGVLILLLSKLTGPLLPGDIFIKKGNLTIYFPIVSSIVISIILTILLNIFRK